MSCIRDKRVGSLIQNFMIAAIPLRLLTTCTLQVAMEDPFSLEVRAPEAKVVSSFPTEEAKVSSFPLTKVV